MKRRERHLWIGLAILSFFLTTFSVDNVSASGEWIDLGTLAEAHGSAQSWGHAISGDGTAVVGWSDDPAYDGNNHAFHWTKATGMTDLGTLPGYLQSQGIDVSGDGSVVVGYSEYAPYPHAFRWTEAGMVALGTLFPGAPPDMLESEALGVSADGNVIFGISAWVGSGNLPRFFLWTQAGGMIDYGEELGMWNWRYALSADGSVVVGTNEFDYVYAHAFRKTPAGVLDLGTLTPGQQSWGYAVSADGSVVVGTADAGVDSHAFRWTESTGMVDLGILPGGTRSEAWGVSADGSVVVGWSNAQGSPSLAFRWTEATGMQTLKQWLADNGVDVLTADFQRANGVSADGDAVAGNLRNNHAFYARVFPNTLLSLDVTLQGPGKGTVTSTDFTCTSGTCTHQYHAGDEVTLTAHPSSGSAFSGWTGCATFSGNKCYVTMDSDKTITASFSGLPRITVTPLSLDFGPVKMDASSTEKTITVTNGGVGDLVISDIAITGVQASQFHQTNDCTTIPADGSCTIRAVLAPTLPFGQKSAKVSISSNDPAKPMLNVVMTGKSPPPKISVLPAPPAILALGPVSVGKTSLPKAITVGNKGISDLVISGINITGPNGSEFGQTSDCTTVPAGGSCTITVTLSPILPFGQKSGKVSISSNDPGKPIVYVPVAGKAAPPKISVSPAPPAVLNLGPVGVGKTSLPKAITVGNKGISDLVISGISITGQNGSEFGQTTDCTTVPAGGSCTVNVTLTPSLPFGPKEATVRISSNDPVTPTVRVKTTGNAPPPKILVTPSPLETLEFGSVEVGSTSLPATVTVSNIGLSDLVVSGISVTGPNGSEFNQTNDCSTVPAETSCTINATFSPASTGMKNASMNISSNGPAKPTVTLKLKGDGIPGTGAGVWDTSTWDNGTWGP